ncbi:MAG: HD domain-containing protein [Ignavibacteriaceae bacterium]|nr:HD domain-containing protein [Ignavibacteriaceae bacterium]
MKSELKKIFQERRDKLFAAYSKQADALRFSKEYSLLIEEMIRAVAGNNKYNFAVASAGSFSRREFSPYSDIDIIFIAESVEDNEKEISELVTKFWDNGLEVSHTVRDLNDIQKYKLTDLHTFTQFFETRYLLGSEKIYNQWNEELIRTLNEDIKDQLIKGLIEDSEERYRKYGNSPKMLEPNVKFSAGGLRDLQLVEWMYIFSKKELFDKQQEATQIETFLKLIKENKITSADECSRVLSSYKLILSVRNLMHLEAKQKNDRFEFSEQIRIAKIFGFEEDSLTDFMRIYFNAAVILNRFSKSMIKKFYDDTFVSLPASLSISLDDDFEMKGRVISMRNNAQLSMSDILRAFYYRGLHSARFDETLRSYIVDKFETTDRHQLEESESSVFFREILKLPKNVGQTLYVMNELGALGAFMPEFKELNGFLQHGVYHSYTADEHTLVAIQNVEKLSNENSLLGRIFNKLKDKEKLMLALLLHDIAKPINISGHEILGAELAASIMYRMGYSDEEISIVSSLVMNHLVMEQTAFRRNLNDPDTLNNFSSRFNSIEELEQLYLLTYADLSAVNPVVWTNWKSELLAELYRKTRAMLEEKISGEELLYSTTYVVPKEISKYSPNISEEAAQNHIDSIDDLAYSRHFSAEEIAKHIEEIEKGLAVSVLFSDSNGYTGITVITKDFPSLLSKLCGVLAINDINIHDAKIFTRKDGIVIDTFNVTDFSTHKKLEHDRFKKIEDDMNLAVRGLLQLGKEVALLKSKWWRIESKLFKKKGNVKVAFENHERYTIIDVHSPDRLGFLYHVTSKMNELGLNIFFAKISTQGDEIVDAFYVLDRNNKKISPNDYEFIKNEITSAIDKLL